MLVNAEFRARCRERGLAATHQRRMIYESVLSMPGHPSPELIFDSVSKKIPSISLATVYKNLRTFIESGMLREVSFHHGCLRVEPNASPHHHLICVQCRKICDLEASSFPVKPSQLKGRLPHGFRVTRITVDVLGVCSNCAATKSSSSNKPKGRERAC